MNNTLMWILVVVFAVACLGTAAYMPLAEAGLLNHPEQITDAMKTWAGILRMPTDVQAVQAPVLALVQNVQSDPNCQYYVYGLFLALSMTFAAVAIAIVGREDAEEKTVLPVKK